MMAAMDWASWAALGLFPVWIFIGMFGMGRLLDWSARNRNKAWAMPAYMAVCMSIGIPMLAAPVAFAGRQIERQFTWDRCSYSRNEYHCPSWVGEKLTEGWKPAEQP